VAFVELQKGEIAKLRSEAAQTAIAQKKLEAVLAKAQEERDAALEAHKQHLAALAEAQAELLDQDDKANEAFAEAQVELQKQKDEVKEAVKTRDEAVAHNALLLEKVKQAEKAALLQAREMEGLR